MSGNILCPGSEILRDELDRPIIHYLKAIQPETGRLLCNQDGCKFVYRDEFGHDNWVSNYMPETNGEVGLS